MTGGREDLPRLVKPVAVFDAGIGSYAAVAALRRSLPQQDILYFADRASFPYGAKSRAELLAILRKTLLFLAEFDPAAILVASNAPSITVLDDLMDVVSVPVLGVRPPVREALSVAGSGEVAVLGVRSMVESPELRAYADREADGQGGRVRLVDASALVELVEGGDFLFRRDETQAAVDAFVAELDRRHPGISVITLSSTHLPWLREYIARAAGGRALLDPIDDAVAAILPHGVAGSGEIAALVTANERYGAAEFQAMLARIGVTLPLHVVRT